MQRLVKKIVDKRIKKHTVGSFIPVTTREFMIMAKNGGHVIFKNEHEEGDKPFHSMVGIMVDGYQRPLKFEIKTKHPIP